jgi:mannose-6-phosphate isomerase-like protein (cupin superfamily)
MPREDVAHCHAGQGTIRFTEVLGEHDPGSARVPFMHDDVLPPNTSIGIHSHSDDHEYYYIVAGRGVMVLDGEEHPVQAGDITAVFPGGSHGLINRSNEDLRIIVISISAKEPA